MTVETGSQTVELLKRIYIPLTATSPPGLVEADTVDPWTKSGKYGLGWTYFCLILVVSVSVTRFYHLWTDKIRQAMHKQEVEAHMKAYMQEMGFGMESMDTSRTVDQLFPRAGEKSNFVLTRGQSHWSSIDAVNDTLALFRWIFYRPVPEIRIGKKVLSFPSLSVIALLAIAVSFVTLYCFLPQPLYWQSIQYGSPPLAIRAGMISVALTPWVVAAAMKANIITLLTGIGHERLGVFHRWGGYLTMFLALVHTVPFYIQPVWKDGGMTVFQKLFPSGSGIIYGSGIACLVPLGWLCVASLPFLRSLAYEVFAFLHMPVAVIYVGVLFWHTKNYLGSWGYLYASAIIWFLSYFIRIFNQNWTKPWRNAWLIGDEAAVTLMSENAIKVTIPTQMKWKPGQYVYLRMPGISFFENHPFTVASLCSEDFPSEYGDLYRDCILVFRPFRGFTRKVLETAIEKGPMKTYRAYLDGPYGGMQRELAAFETVILFAGGSGITAIVSQLLDLIKRMRDGKAVTKKIEVIWALKKLEAMDWFREELRICREHAPPDTVTCQFFVTGAKRHGRAGVSERAPRPISNLFHDKLDGFVANVAARRNSALIRDEAQGDIEREMELRAEEEDAITSLPQQKHLQPRVLPPQVQLSFPPPPKKAFRDQTLKNLEGKRNSKDVQDQSHEHSRRYLAPSPVPFSRSPTGQEFHYPPSPRSANSPQFQFAPHPSPGNRTSMSTYSSPGQTFPPPPPGPPPQGSRSTSPLPPDIKQDSKSPEDLVVNESQWSHLPPRPQPPPIPDEPTPAPPAHLRQKSGDLHIEIPKTTVAPAEQSFDFGFPSTPTEFQKSLMRFAFINPKKKEGWSTEYGRPNLGYMLKEMATGGADGKGIFGRRTCVFVCGPPSMRVDVANAVARLQADIWGDNSKDEIFLHTENYAI